ncbi:MAG: response regulator transcription factor [Flavobacteriales bacterium]|nr:response regulator transcription factor [Flavobacteriales bacterium]
MSDHPIRAVLVDDEEHCTVTLRWMLEKYCPKVRVEAVFNEPTEALKHLKEHGTDLLFLDIQMPVMNAFDLLQGLGDHACHVIFTTAYDEFAMKAIKHNALDYLLKPVEKGELISAVAKVEHAAGKGGAQDRLGELLRQMAPQRAARIAIPTREGLEMLALDRIAYATADDNYTVLHLTDGARVLVSRTLKDVERDLPADRFVRIHLSHVVAIDRVVRYVRGAGGYVVLAGGEELPVSRSRKEELLQVLGAR